MQALGAGGQLGMVVELLVCSGTGPFALAPAWKKKRIRMISVDKLRRKMQIGLQLLPFQAVEGQEMARLGGLALEWAPGTC